MASLAAPKPLGLAVSDTRFKVPQPPKGAAYGGVPESARKPPVRLSGLVPNIAADADAPATHRPMRGGRAGDDSAAGTLTSAGSFALKVKELPSGPPPPCWLPDDVNKKKFLKAEKAFLAAFPQYESTRVLDHLRATEYARLDAKGHAYLDYTGGSLYADSQIATHMRQLQRGTFGNPHSENPSSAAATKNVEGARAAVLRYLNADPAEYDVIFTLNASGALKLVGEGYPFGKLKNAPEAVFGADADRGVGRFLLFEDDHNSVNGIREFAKKAGAPVDYVPLQDDDLRVVPSDVSTRLAVAGGKGHRLFAFPAQSNFSGVKHDLRYVKEAQANGWDVLLDAAAFLPTNKLDLSGDVKPEYICMSFYKLFGYPTGTGALVMKRQAMAKLRRPWFAGGTVEYVFASHMFHKLHSDHEAFEDGTINYLGIPAVKIGLNHIERIGIDKICTRVHCLASYVVAQLSGLTHSNGQKLVVFLGGTDMSDRGGTLAMQFCDPDGQLYLTSEIERAASAKLISVRGGCFCNPGAGEKGLHVKQLLAPATLERLAANATSEDGELGSTMASSVSADSLNKTEPTPLNLRSEVMHSVAFGALRASFGIASNFADAYRFVQLVTTFVDAPNVGTCKIRIPHAPPKRLSVSSDEAGASIAHA